MKSNDFVKPDEAYKRYCKREQRKFTFNLSSAAISYPKSKAKFVHARGEKSHFEKELNLNSAALFLVRNPSA